MDAPKRTRRNAKALRRTMSLPEVLLWIGLKARRLEGLHFRKQHPVGPYVLDFYCAKAKLCVEVDGPVHDEQRDSDQRRTAWLAKEGVTVLRFATAEVEARPAAVLAAVAQAAPPFRRLRRHLPPQAGEGPD